MCRPILCMHKPHAEKYISTLLFKFYLPFIEVEIISTSATGGGGGGGGASHAAYQKLCIQADVAWMTQF